MEVVLRTQSIESEEFQFEPKHRKAKLIQLQVFLCQEIIKVKYPGTQHLHLTFDPQNPSLKL